MKNGEQNHLTKIAILRVLDNYSTVIYIKKWLFKINNIFLK